MKDEEKTKEQLLEELKAARNLQSKHKQGKDELERIFNLTPDMICIAGANGYFKRLNPMWEEVLGYTVEELLSKPFLEFIHPDDRMATIAEVEKQLAGSPSLYFENRYLCKDGSYRVLAWKAYAAEGGLLYGAARDITEHKKMEDDLRDSEEKWRSIAENSPDYIMLLDRDAKILFINRTVPDLSREGVIGRSNFDFMPPETHKYVADHFKHVFETGKPTTYNIEYHTKDGKIRYFEVRLGPVFHNGKVCALVSSSNDITERRQVEVELREYRKSLSEMVEKRTAELQKTMIECKKAEEALRKSEASLAEAQRIAHIGNWDWDILNNELYWSDEICRIFGLTPKEFGATYEAFLSSVHPNDREFVKKSVDAAFIERKPYSIDHRIVLPDGKERIVHEEAEVTFDEAGKPVRMVGTVHDITERKGVEENLRRTQKIESLGILAGGIAHDFNNLLTAILGNVALAKLTTDSKDKLLERLTEAENASLRAQDLTHQLLTFARGGAPILRTVSIGEILKDSCSFALRGSIVVAEFYIPDDLSHVKVDKGQISQVIHNLAINAVQAMPQGGTLEVRAENTAITSKDIPYLKDGRYIKISVKDHGIGIPKEHFQKVFDPYFTTKDKGNGLGLAITYSILKNHNGYINIESELGVGTTFNIYLPESDKEIDIEKEITKGPIHGSGKILIMDDEEIIRNFVGDALSYLGYEIEYAKDGAEAIKLYKKAKETGQSFVAVIMDLTIRGGMGGKEAIEELLKIDPRAKVIASSGYSNDQIISNYKKYGFKGALVKPYKPSDLSETLNKVIG